jgi:DNA modification methylase
MQMENRRLADLKPAEYNPRKALQPGDPEYVRIKNSIDEFGYCDPIIINSDGTIIGGHQRQRVMLDMGIETADVVVLDVDKAHEKALNIALNKITGAWDESKLKDLLVELDETGLGIEITGYTHAELDDLVEKMEITQEAQDDGFDPDAAAADISEPITKPGDIWHLGRHRLMCGDSTSAGDMAALMGAERADLIITDPPYNVDYGNAVKHDGRESQARKHNGQGSAIANDNMDEESFYKFLLTAFENMREVCRPGAAVYVFHADTHGGTFREAFTDAGWKLAQCLIWEKNALVLGRQDYQWRHEPILYGWLEGAAHYFVKDRTQDTIILQDPPDFENMKKAEVIAWIEKLQRENAFQTSVIYEKKPTRSDMHPTMKPVPLVGKLMTNSSRPDWNVLDPFGGSGTTIIAAEQLGRTAFSMEYDPKFCDVIVRRWEELTGEKAVLNEGK